jgi:Cdc6-like AAA superfamily ATPase
VLQAIQQQLRYCSSCLSKHGLPELLIERTELQIEQLAFSLQIQELADQAVQIYSTFNTEQEQVYIALASITATPVQPILCFLEGRTGHGKTFLINCLVTEVWSCSNIVIIVGSSVLSIVYYNRGRTVYSIFGIPVIQDINNTFTFLYNA